MSRVTLVDDQDLIRAGLATVLGADPDLEVVAEAGDGFAALRQLETTAVDVVLMDLRVPGIDGAETTERIRARWSVRELRILVLTTFDQDENVVTALHRGADGFLGKGASPTELTDAVLRVAGGGRVLSASAVDAVVDHVAGQKRVPDDPSLVALFAQLTPREREVVQGVVSGADGDEVARLLLLSPSTVKTHLNRAMTEVGASDRGQLVSLAVRAGILP